jgi:hypothetical protein
MPDAANTLVGAGAICLDGVDIGFTEGGVVVRRDQEINNIMADQVLSPVRKFRTSETFVIATSLLEATLENLRLVYGYPDSQLSGDCLTLGYQNSCFMAEHELVIKGPGPGCGCRTFVFDRVVAIQSSTEYQLSREDKVVLAVEFEALVNDDGTVGQVCDGCTFADTKTCT